ncbi:hypothetical protein GCM10010869_07520 [Mesorhizobium tianshanense]|nr:hypothetical protein GCM10010869_07520 [Mesorhizobium tianshanense]
MLDRLIWDFKPGFDAQFDVTYCRLQKREILRREGFQYMVANEGLGHGSLPGKSEYPLTVGGIRSKLAADVTA